MILYKHECAMRLRGMLLSIHNAAYFCYGNGHKVTHEHTIQICKILSEAADKIEAIKCRRTGKKFE